MSNYRVILLASLLGLAGPLPPASPQVAAPSTWELGYDQRGTHPSHGGDSLLIIPRTGAQVPAPTTDEDALRLLDYDQTPLTATLRGLYRTYRRQGHDVLGAYVKTLEALVAAEKAPPQ